MSDRQYQDKIINFDYDIQRILKKKGIHNFLTTNGNYYIDYFGNSYGANCFFVNRDNFCRMVKKIDFVNDTYILIKERSRCYALPDDVEIKFLGKEPLADVYNGASIEKIAHYFEGGYDGSTEYKVFSATLFTVMTKYEKPAKFVANREDDIILEPF